MKKKMETSKKKLPFSKANVVYARLEAYVFSIVLIALVFLDKDVSSIAILLSLAWTGYKALQMFYIKMAEREHLEELRLGRRLENLDTSDLDYKIEELDSVDITTQFENDIY